MITLQRLLRLNMEITLLTPQMLIFFHVYTHWVAIFLSKNICICWYPFIWCKTSCFHTQFKSPLHPQALWMTLGQLSSFISQHCWKDKRRKRRVLTPVMSQVKNVENLLLALAFSKKTAPPHTLSPLLHPNNVV